MSESKKTSFILKLVLLGDGAVGKTSLIMRYVNHTFSSDYHPTLGINIVTKEIENKDLNRIVKLVVWDIAGQEKYDFSRKMFFQGSVGALLVYDVSRNSSFENVQNKWINDFREFGNQNSVYLLIGNKMDLTSSRAVTFEDGKKLAQKIKATDFIETSAKKGDNVEIAFKKLVDHVISSMQ
jgi:Ras-related protein Rab-11A